MRTFLGVFFVLIVGCSSDTSPLSSLCDTANDCTDPARPYCVHGACHACDGPTACTAELPRCSPDELVCSGCTADRDCGAHADTPRCGPDGACVGCVSDDQCANPAPVCDATAQACRACREDAECPSQVCETDTGSCVPEAEVLYASPAGADSGGCTQAAPCTIDQALAHAASSTATVPTIRMLPGTYTTFPGLFAAGTLRIHAAGATLQARVIVSETRLTLRGLTIDGDMLYCRPGSSVIIEDVAVTNASGIGILASGTCAVHARRTRLVASAPVQLESGGAFLGDQIAMQGQPMLGSDGRLSLTNSVVEGAPARGSGASLSMLDVQISYSTLILRDQEFIDCRPPAMGTHTLQLENNIIYSLGAPQFGGVVHEPSGATSCTRLEHNLTFPQMVELGGTNRALDPRLVDAAGGDYHLQATSPAIDAAMPSPGLETDHDHESTPRPQGAGPDIGAFERIP